MNLFLAAVCVGTGVMTWWCWDKYRSEGADHHLFLSGWFASSTLASFVDLLAK